LSVISKSKKQFTDYTDYTDFLKKITQIFFRKKTGFPLPDRVEDKLRGNDTRGIPRLVKSVKSYYSKLIERP